ncbi:lipopolysaccharide biosynthesis protein [Chroococcidiopsis sp. TS-821]|uniref:lipopolysaccharide biosynthesis protein n=1 Tax=Chroococcidiopsis sp. TS-821 TaxID=1378066 RepID=UPI000CEDC94F|nr:lipopolysaccharide biosynthesis protein [Chroococcidiopsis sp. TS-821]PPS43914.1 lipopolysaccharide biosynthesis protein [Chroococcidiopsis sp. TS-821]
MTPDPVRVDSNQYIQTDALNAQLQKRSRKSGLVTVAAQPIKVALGIGSTAILARLLTPADFGLLAMVAPLLKLVDSLANLGLETATVQREKLDHQQASAVFWLSLKINAVVLGLMVLMAPVLARFYQQNELTEITIALAVGVLSLCLTFQHKSLLKRQMRFEAITAIEIGSLLAGAISAIAAAWLGLGYWALVLQIVVMQLTQSIASWFVCGWRPARYVKSNALDFNLRAMVAYGAHLTGFRFLTRIGMSLDRILIGYLSGAGALGFYAVAYQWAYFPFEQIYHPLFDVAVSSFSRTQHDPQLYRAYCRRGLMPIFAFSMPILAFGFVVARDIVLLLLGNQWLPAVPLLQVLAIAVFVGSMYRVTKWLYVSTSQTDRQLRWGLIHTPVMIGAVAIGAMWGAFGVAVGYAAGICLLTYPSVAFCLKTSPLSTSDFFGVVWRPAFASIIAAIILYATQFALPLNQGVLSLLLKTIVFSVFYLLLWILLGGMQLFKSSRNL